MKVSKYSNFSDEQLFNFIEGGDKMAFTEAYNKYHRLLYSLSYRYLMDSEKAEEAVQYVFVRLWEYRSDLNIGISLKNYLFTMTKNYVLNVIRNENTAIEKQYELAQRTSEFEDDFVEKLEKRERMDIFYKALGKLPEQKREICLLKVREELSNKEIAERMEPVGKYHKDTLLGIVETIENVSQKNVNDYTFPYTFRRYGCLIR